MSIRIAAAPFPMLHYTAENGLPSGKVYDIYRDSKGFLWFATDKGIARYNGIRFERFTTFDGLPDNEVFSFQEDYEGRLWIGTYNGALCFYKDGRFYNPGNTAFLNTPYRNWSIRGMILAPDSSLVVYSLGSANFIDIKGGKYRLYETGKTSKAAAYEDFIHAEKQPPDHYLLYRTDSIVTTDTACRVLQTRAYRHGGGYRYAICQDQHYLFSDKGIYNMAEDLLFAFTKQAYKAQDVCRIYADNRNFFVGTYNHGLYINDSIHILEDDKISAITQDAAGHYWISTLNDGVYMMDKHFMQAQQYDNVYKGQVKYAFADRGCLFFITDDNSLYRYRNGKVKCLFDYPLLKGRAFVHANQPAYVWYKGACYSFYNDEYFILSDLHNDHPHIIKGSVDQYDNFKGIQVCNSRIYLKRFTHIEAFDIDSLQRGGRHKACIIACPEKPPHILAFAAGITGNVWFSTGNNVYKVENEEAQVQPQFKYATCKWFSIYGHYMVGCTWSNRLFVCDLYDKQQVNFIAWHNCIWDQSCCLDAAHILLGTERQYRILTIDAGVAGLRTYVRTLENPFVPEQPDYISVTDSACFFLKKSSVTRLDKNSLFAETISPRPIITSLHAGGKVYTANDTDIRIPFRESGNIDIGFTAASFGSADVFYECSVSKDGRDNWRQITGSEINLIMPGYGDFTVKLRARTLSSKPSGPVVFKFTVLRPFYVTWWFVALATVACIILLWLLVRAILKYMLRKREREHEIHINSLRSEYKALNALMNPHFIFNSLTNIQGLINEKDGKAANQYLKIFSELIRQNMHNVSSELIPLQKEIDLVANYLKLEKLRFKERFNYTVDVDEEVETDIITIPPLLIQPLVENAIRHGLLPRQEENNFVSLRIYEQGRQVCIEIKDNGIGISRSRGHKDPLHESFGLRNIDQRIEQLRLIHSRSISFHIADITGADGAVCGTAAVIMIGIDDLS